MKLSRQTRLPASLLVLGILLLASVPTLGDDYVLSFNTLPKNLEDDIVAAGGTLTDLLEEIDVVLVSTESPDFLANVEGMPGLADVTPDIVMNWVPMGMAQFLADEATGDSAGIGDDEPYFWLQWALDAIDAPEAWEVGRTGAGVRIAVLDSGIDPYHPDLAANLNAGLSASYVPYEPFINDLHFHGTHVSGIIAAADNQFGVIGVAPNAEIVAVKVLDGNGSGAFSWILQGILHAVDIDANIINMSIGAYVDQDGFYDDDGTWVAANEVAAFLNVVRKVINYADGSGVLVVASAGNSGLDGTGDAGLVHVPSDLGEAVCVSATGPVGWIFDPTVDLDTPAIYTNYGSPIDFAAPGGNDVLYPENGWWYDMVLSTIPGGWAWADGTSMAAPHVCGVAALIIERNGGPMKPALVKQQLRQSADDLGRAGRDPFYGHGRVNAYKAAK